MEQQSYLIHGLNLTLAGEPQLLKDLRARLGRFQAGIPGVPPDIHFEFIPSSHTTGPCVKRPPGPGRVILGPDFGEVLYFETTDQLYLADPDGIRAVSDLRQGRVLIEHGPLDRQTRWLLSHLFFTVFLMELLKRRGLYMVHAAGLALGGRGLLIAGASGAGKTTLALTLLRAGFGFLGDDTIILDADAKALAFPDEIDITPQTARFFPELESLTHDPAPGEPPKHSFCADQVYAAPTCWQCVPMALIFPTHTPAPASLLSPMPADQALLHLACNVLRTEQKTSQAHLTALAALVTQCRCYRLATGRDFDRLPDLLRTIIE